MNNTLEYKNYHSKIEFSANDRIFFGTIIGISDLVTFEGESVSEIEKAFHEAVDDYLDMCMRYGKEPDKAYKGSFNVRISPDLHKKIAIEAIRCNISLNQFVECAIKKYVEYEYSDIEKITIKLGEMETKFSSSMHEAMLSLWSKATPFVATPYLMQPRYETRRK
jgi:predicted HicB family RNase H-like nuclease